MITEIEVYFTIYGDNFDPDEISKVLSIKPTKIWRKGDQRSNTKLLFPDNGWSISTKSSKSYSVLKEIKKLLKKIDGKTEVIKNTITKYQLESELSVVIYLDKATTPEISFDNYIISQLSMLGSSIDIDIM